MDWTTSPATKNCSVGSAITPCLIGTFGSHLDRDRLTDKLKRHGYDPDLGRPSARTLYGRVPTESGYGNGSRQRGPRVARWLATEYDKGLSEAKRLNLS